MDNQLREFLACPQCHGPLQLHPNRQWLVCASEKLAYPVKDGIPHLLIQEAVQMPDYEVAPMAPPDSPTQAS